MKRKHPKRKQPIAGFTAEQLEAPRNGLSREVFGVKLRGLKHDVAPGLGCLRKEHLSALNLIPARQQTPSAANTVAVGNFYDYAVVVSRVLLPEYFYWAWVACRIVPANKISPDDLLPGMRPDYKPVNIGVL